MPASDVDAIDLAGYTDEILTQRAMYHKAISTYEIREKRRLQLKLLINRW